MMRGPALAALLVAAVVLAGCSSDEESSPPADTSSGLTTVPPSIVPLTTTTTIEGTPVSDAEIYAQVGLTVEQGACIAASGAEGEFESTPGPALTDAMVLAAETGAMVAIPATLRTSTELELTILTALAGDCAPADRLAALAAVDGQALDDAALADDLPVRLFHRTRDGATPAELACIEAKFREAPARLSSLAANPRLVESQCAPAERLASWRTTALDRGLGAAEATSTERACLASPSAAADQALLAAAVDAVGSGDTSSDPLAGATPSCSNGARLYELALNIVALGDDFGVEPLRAS